MQLPPSWYSRRSTSLTVCCVKFQCKCFAHLTLHAYDYLQLILLVGSLVIISGISIKPVCFGQQVLCY